MFELLCPQTAIFLYRVCSTVELITCTKTQSNDCESCSVESAIELPTTPCVVVDIDELEEII